MVAGEKNLRTGVLGSPEKSMESRVHMLEAARIRAWPRWRWRQAPEAQNISMELSELIDNTVDGTSLQADGATDKDNVAKNNGTDGSFFDCNICLELARDPVVTCCGHLFCWPCLYRWLQLHAEIKECQGCKGEVTFKNVTPIYGRGNNIHEPEEDPTLKIPVRPHARRVESLRQTIHRNVLNFPMEEMIQRLGNRYDLTRDFFQLRDSDGTRETGGRTASLIDRFGQWGFSCTQKKTHKLKMDLPRCNSFLKSLTLFVLQNQACA
ncbi:hypothetical protein NL676_000529 [Syzygium grande]|nr:hypothetical protein NL676_000529 [Syzygium grande]